MFGAFFCLLNEWVDNQFSRSNQHLTCLLIHRYKTLSISPCYFKCLLSQTTVKWHFWQAQLLSYKDPRINAEKISAHMLHSLIHTEQNCCGKIINPCVLSHNHPAFWNQWRDRKTLSRQCAGMLAVALHTDIIPALLLPTFPSQKRIKICTFHKAQWAGILV